jgi:hypothetical protein
VGRLLPAPVRLATVALPLVCAAVLAPRSLASPGTAIRPSLAATFTHTSYVPGQLAELVVHGHATRLQVQILRAGAERSWSAVGRPWGPERTLLVGRGKVHRLLVRIGAWDSGLYFARLIDPVHRKVAYAPFVLRPGVLGRNRVAIVLPTYSWQAYNFYDANGDGKPDSWYADPRRHNVLLGRPYAGDGKPPHYRTQQRGFLRFLVHTGKKADYLSDEDLERFQSGDELAGLYDLIILSGHEEYVTGHIYDLVQRYRDLGGNLAFLSADNFFRRVDLSHGQLWLINLWRNLGRPEAALIGDEYRGNDRGGHVAPYVIANAEAAPWLFEGLGLGDGSQLGTVRYGIEFDMPSADSPPGTTVLAEVDPPVLENGTLRGDMTYYETDAGAKVFAAGTLGFGGSDNPVATVLFQNLWQHLSVP